MFPNRPARPGMILAAVSIIASCGGDATGPGGDRIPAASLAGTWTATLADDACAAGPLVWSVSATDQDVEPFGSLNFITEWHTAALSGPMYGTLNVQTRVVTLHLFSPDGVTAGAVIDGSLDADRNLAGALTDPYAGLQPLFGGGNCKVGLVAHVGAP